MCRSRRELSKEYLLAKIGVDTAENEPLEVWGEIQFIFHSPPYSRAGDHREHKLALGYQLSSRDRSFSDSINKTMVAPAVSDMFLC